MEPASPFQQKTKMEYTCETCNSNYKLIFFDEEVLTSPRYCPFCGEEIDETLAYTEETNPSSARLSKDDKSNIYTDDDGALYENDLMDDDY